MLRLNLNLASVKYLNCAIVFWKSLIQSLTKLSLLYYLCRGVATGGRDREVMAPLIQFTNQTRSKSFNFKHQGYCFLCMFRNYTDQKFHDFYCVCYNFWSIYDKYECFLTTYEKFITSCLPSEKVWYLTLDLLKSFSLWTIWKKTTMNENLLNVRLYTESWTYWKGPLKQQKYLYIWCQLNMIA